MVCPPEVRAGQRADRVMGEFGLMFGSLPPAARKALAAALILRLKSVITMCYYELPEVQREIGYDPAPYIAAVSRRRLESYGPDIRAGEAAATATPERDEP